MKNYNFEYSDPGFDPTLVVVLTRVYDFWMLVIVVFPLIPLKFGYWIVVVHLEQVGCLFFQIFFAQIFALLLKQSFLRSSGLCNFCSSTQAALPALKRDLWTLSTLHVCKSTGGMFSTLERRFLRSSEWALERLFLSSSGLSVLCKNTGWVHSTLKQNNFCSVNSSARVDSAYIKSRKWLFTSLFQIFSSKNPKVRHSLSKILFLSLYIFS